MGKPGSRGWGKIGVMCHADKELRLAPQILMVHQRVLNRLIDYNIYLPVVSSRS